MIVVDSSVWISRFRGYETPQVYQLRELILRNALIMGDLILMELLQGARSEEEASDLSRAFGKFTIAPMLSPALAIKVAENYRSLRRKGITIRKTIDLIIGTFCIENGYSLLHADRDFQPMATYLGLRLA